MPNSLVNKLRRHDLTPQEAIRWAAFITTVINALREAETVLKETDSWNDLLSKIAPKIRPTEPDLNVEIYRKIKDIKKNAPLDNPIRDIEFESEPPYDDPNRTGINSRKPDFLATRYFEVGLALEFAIEAKRLLKKGEINSAYLSEAGIGCFISNDSPYTRAPIAAMLAYFFEYTEEYWRESIIDALLVSSLPVSKCHELKLVGESSPTHCSDLKRTNLDLPDITVLHLSMGF